MTRTVVIAQARMGSTRLPGKVLQTLGDKTVLGQCLVRALVIPGVDAVCLATSDLAIDDDIEDAAAGFAGVTVVRGHPTDVLARYHAAAAATRADVILRITCDCPLIDPEVCGALIALRARTDAPYACNNLLREWPHGLDCEAFPRSALDAAARMASDPYDREHVGPWMRRTAGERIAHLHGPGGELARHRWTLDYPEDLAFFRALWPLLPKDRIASWSEVATILDSHPEISAINERHRIADVH